MHKVVNIQMNFQAGEHLYHFIIPYGRPINEIMDALLKFQSEVVDSLKAQETPVQPEIKEEVKSEVV